jgi:hypothetical protein
MPTLSDILRNYTPSTESALADPITQHFANLPSVTQANLQNQIGLLEKAIPTNKGYKEMFMGGDPAAQAELTAQGMGMGSTTPAIKYVAQKLSPVYEKIAKSYFPGKPQSSLDDVLRQELTGFISGGGDIPTKKGFQEFLKYNYANDTLGTDGYPLKEGLKRLNELVNSKTIVFKPSRKELIEEQLKKVE